MKKLFLILLVIAIAGCGTITTSSKYPYGGARQDLVWINNTFAGCTHPIVFLLAIIDLPLSLVVDTLVLPVTIVNKTRDSCHLRRFK